ncbi:hypothetical protein [Chondromyces crocatus]|uniref:hypothetical protein n=1 Tax=Chondromyces crocatus TaxID=52 RepID=UPI0012E3242A|nr:hypothetical protein [Chondromyces crocatus]
MVVRAMEETRTDSGRRGRQVFAVAGLVGVLSGALLGGAGAALAAQPAEGHAGTSGQAVGRGLVLVLEGRPLGVEAESLRAAIEHELGATVTLASGAGRAGTDALVLRGEAESRAVMTFRAADGRIVERAVELPKHAKQAVEVLALLAGNLVRDEAAELSALLGRHAPSTSAPTGADGAPPATAEASGAPTYEPSAKEVRSKAATTEAPVPARTASSFCGTAGTVVSPFGFDLAPHVGTSSFTGVEVKRHVALNATLGLSKGPVGFELSLGASFAREGACGVQLAGGANLVTGTVAGWQTAIVGNLSHDVAGVQVTGGLNFARGNARGLQLGAVNVATGEAQGVQFGGVNVAAGGMEGVQVGLVNVARRSTLSLGLLSIVPDGRLHLDLWATDAGIFMAGLKHGGNGFHNIYGVGLRPEREGVRGVAAFGLGGHIQASPRLFVDVDMIGYPMLHSSGAQFSLMLQLRAVLGVQLTRGLALFGGPELNQIFSDDVDASSLGLLGGARLHEGVAGFALRSLWPGLTLGVQGL